MLVTTLRKLVAVSSTKVTVAVAIMIMSRICITRTITITNPRATRSKTCESVMLHLLTCLRMSAQVSTVLLCRSGPRSEGAVKVTFKLRLDRPEALAEKPSRRFGLILLRALAYESIEPRLKLFRPRLEPGLVYPRVWRTWDGPHLLVVGAVGKEKPVAEIGVEGGAVVGEPPVRHGVRIRDRAPLLSTQPTARKGRQDQNLRLGLSRADFRDEACVA